MRTTSKAAAVAVLLLAAAAWLGLAPSAPQREAEDASLQRVLDAGVLRVGYAVEAPYAWVDAEGRVTGESPESARRIAERMGVPRVEFVQVPFGQLIPSLLERRFDVVGAGLFVTEERRRRVRFAAPTLRVRPGLLVPVGNPKDLQSTARAAVLGELRFAVIQGAVEESRLRALGVPPARLLGLPDAQAAMAAVASGAADALALSLPSLRWMATRAPGSFEVLADEGAAAEDRIGFAFHPEDAALLAAWDRAQAAWTTDPGWHQLAQRFGFEDEDRIAALVPPARQH